MYKKRQVWQIMIKHDKARLLFKSIKQKASSNVIAERLSDASTVRQARILPVLSSLV
jgi:hypothetical protein